MQIERKDLEEKTWYRGLKVLYIFAYISSLLLLAFGLCISVVLLVQGEGGMWGVILAILLGFIGVQFIFYLISNSFFYVVTGKWGKRL